MTPGGRLVALMSIFALGCGAPDRSYASRDGGAPIDSGFDAALPDTAPPCPAGPYGLKVGDTFPNMTLEGYRDGVGEWTKLQVCDYYDPDGKRGVNAILINASAAWCTPCNSLARLFPKLEARFGWRGAKLVELLVDGFKTEPASEATIEAWQKTYALPIDTLIDPDQEYLDHDTPDFGFPTQWYVDPRTMLVVSRGTGEITEKALAGQLEPILKANGAPPPAETDAGIDDATADAATD
jgi:hypothetical protein